MMRALAMRLYHLGTPVSMQGDLTAPPLGVGDLFFADLFAIDTQDGSAGGAGFGSVRDKLVGDRVFSGSEGCFARDILALEGAEVGFMVRLAVLHVEHPAAEAAGLSPPDRTRPATP